MLKRLRDWWTRPSWEEYLAEQQACVDAYAAKDDLRTDNIKLQRRVIELNAEKSKRIKGQAALASMLNRDLQEVCDDRDRVKERAENAEGECSSLTTKLYFADAECERLRKLLMQQVEASPILSIDIEPDGVVDIAMKPPEWAIKSMAVAFHDVLAAAPNWRALEVGPFPHSGVSMIVTVCRKSGDSPVETVGKLRDCVEKLVGSLEWADEKLGFDGCCLRDEDNAAIKEARALLNPEKKETPCPPQ
jgi:hypothetical protein